MIRVYYDDGSVWKGDIPPAEKRWGVVCIAQPSTEVGRNVVSGAEYYYRRGGRWKPLDTIVDFVDTVIRWGPEVECWMKGALVSPEAFNEIMRQAVTEGNLPPKTAKFRTERLERGTAG